jgi:pimeloyl-ACP methyl ester carboxylesterase
MRKLILFTLLNVFQISLVFGQQNISGKWKGQLESSMGEIQLLLSITNSPLVAEISTSAGIDEMKIKDLSFDGQNLDFKIPSFEIIYKGVLSNDVIKGVWYQGKSEVNLNFTRSDGNELKKPLRKQTPVNFTNYKAEEIQFRQMHDGALLVGTLTIPDGAGPFPAVILLSVAGLNDRDQTHSQGHKPFFVLADHLSKQGIAVLRYDDRGFGESEGNLMKSDFSTLTNDALSAFRYLTTREKIDSTKIGFIGNSEGSVIAGMSAISETNVAFTIMLGAVGVPLSELLVDRLDKMQDIYQLSKPQKEELINYSNDLEKIIASTIPIEQKRSEIEALKADNTLDKPGFPNQLFFLPDGKQDRIDLYLTPWYQAQVTYNPQSVLEKLTCPALVINGSLDPYQSPELNLPPIQEALFKGGNSDFTIMVAPNVNHVMQDAKTGLPTEYLLLENSVSPLILRTVTDWINARY